MQADGPDRVDVAVQNAIPTRNVMVDTCYRYLHSSNFVVTEDIAVQCGEDGEQIYKQLPAKHKRLPKPALALVKQHSEDLDTMEKKSKSIRRNSMPDSHNPRSNSARSTSRSHEKSRSNSPSGQANSPASDVKVVGQDDGDYSSDWDSGDDLPQRSGHRSLSRSSHSSVDDPADNAGPVNIAVREDAHN